MSEPRDITYPIKLTTSELAYLLGIVAAETLIGADNQALFPQNEAAREEQWRRGRDRLEADGWLVWDATAGNYALSDPLMIIIAALADPEVVLLTEWQGPDQQRHGVNHYLSLDLVIEMVRQDDQYRLIVLESVETMAERLGHTFELPEVKRLEAAFEVSRDEVEQMKHHPDLALLLARGVSQETAQLFATSLRQPQHSGTITLLRTSAGQTVTMRLVGLLVGGDRLGWLATPLQDRRLHYWAADLSDLKATLHAGIAELRSLPVELVNSERGS